MNAATAKQPLDFFDLKGVLAARRWICTYRTCNIGHRPRRICIRA